MKKIQLLIAVMGLLSFAACGGGDEDVGKQYQPTITLAQYDQVQNGMSYAQVVAIFGREGSVSHGGTDPNHPSGVSYAWYNAPENDEPGGFHGVMVAFENDRVYTKGYTP